MSIVNLINRDNLFSPPILIKVEIMRFISIQLITKIVNHILHFSFCFRRVLNPINHPYLLPVMILISDAKSEPPNAREKFIFPKNVSDYSIDNKALFESLAVLAATNPQFGSEVGIGILRDKWSSISIYPNSDSKQTKYRVEIFNSGPFGEFDNYKYKLDLFLLKKIEGTDDQIKTDRFGYYSDQRIIKRLLSAVCAENGCAIPNLISDKIQVAPGTRSEFTTFDRDLYDMLEKNLVKTKFILESPKNPPDAKILVSLPLAPSKIEICYELYIYNTPGIVRVVKLKKADSGNIVASELGLMENKEVWQAFCEKFATTQK